MKLYIYYEGCSVGELYTDSSGICFRYSDEYLGGHNWPISLSLPLSAEVYRQKAALPFFDGLLPEEGQRKELSDALQVSGTSTMKLLAALAGECVGNLTILNQDMDINQVMARSAYFLVEDSLLAELLKPRSLQRNLFIAQRRLSLAGAQAKIGLYFEAGRWFAADGLAPTTHIIKPASLFDPTVLVNELFMMRLAASCGLPTPETQVIRSGGNLGFVVKRFDRVAIDGKITRLAQEDFCQALARMPYEKYQHNGGPGLTELFSTVKLHSSRPMENMLQLLRTVLFNYLVGNCDAHAKNFSLLRYPDGSLTVAPVYDLISTTFYGDRLLQSMAMAIGRHSNINKIDAEDFALLAAQSDISPPIINQTLSALGDAISNNLDGTCDEVIDTLPENAAVIRDLRSHLLAELEIRGHD